MLETLLAADGATQAWLVSLPRWWPLDWLMLAASGIGWRGLVWLGIALVAAVRWRGLVAMAAWRVALAILVCGLVVSTVLKPLVGRERPFRANPGSRLIGPASSGASFPSGHAADAVAGAYAVSLLRPARRRVWWSLAVLIGLSRLYLGVHYPLDVLAGALVGWACASFVTARTTCHARGQTVR